MDKVKFPTNEQHIVVVNSKHQENPHVHRAEDLSEISEFVSLLAEAFRDKILPHYPSSELKHMIAEYYQVDKDQINKVFNKARRHMRRASKYFRDNARDMLLKWIEEHDSLFPTSEQYSQLHEETGWSKDQLYAFFYQQRNRGKSMGEREKMRIKEWFEEHWRDASNRDRAPVKELCEEIELPRPQVLKYLWILEDDAKYPQKTLTPKIKERIQSFVEKHPQATSDQISKLQVELQVNRTQIHTAMSRYRDPPGTITPKAKEIIYEHVNRNEKIDLQMLQKITGLSKRQVHDIKRRYTTEKFSPEKRKELEELWADGYRDLDDFVYRSSLTREQIRKWLWQKKRRVSDEEEGEEHGD